MIEWIRKELSNMADNAKLKAWLQLILMLLGVTEGAIALGMIFWKGGALVNDHEAVKARVTAIEASGSRVVSEHIKLDDYREKVDSERLAKLEAIVQLIPDLTMKVAVIDAKMDGLKSSLDDHRKAVNGNIGKSP